MAYTQGQVDALQRAIATGAVKVRAANGSEVHYNSIAEMKALLEDMKREVAGSRRTTFVNPDFDRGLA